MANENYVNDFYDNAARAALSAAIVSQKANVCPFTVRLAWHASGTFDKSDSAVPGGSDGATMRFEPELSDGANAGLRIMHEVLKPVHRQFPHLSIADLWTLAGAQAVKLVGGPDVPHRPGRSDQSDNGQCPPNGRLPDASQGADHLRAVFYRMGFTDQEIVALSGAHTLGSCHKTRSGYDGPWTQNPLQFDNEYFTNLLNLTWTKRAWDGPEQYEDPSGKLMMLPTDMCLIQDDKFLPHVKAYAADEALFAKDFAAAFGKLLALGCPAQCKPDAPKPQALGASPDKEFRDLAMHGSIDRMKLLVADDGVAVNINSTEPHSHRTAAHKAAYFGHANVIEYLASLSTVNLNAQDSAGDTPLHDAARFGHKDIVTALIKAGADKTVANKIGKTPVEVAIDQDHDDVASLLEKDFLEI
jgi:catalase (peroxidase I)